MREFTTGATRDNDENKFDYDGFLSPFVLERYAQYMHQHRKQADGKLRDSDNWKKGIPQEAYMKSAFRHFVEWWKAHNGAGGDIEDAICALIFNAMGYLHNRLVMGHVPQGKVPPDLRIEPRYANSVILREWDEFFAQNGPRG